MDIKNGTLEKLLGDKIEAVSDRARKYLSDHWAEVQAQMETAEVIFRKGGTLRIQMARFQTRYVLEAVREDAFSIAALEEITKALKLVFTSMASLLGAKASSVTVYASHGNTIFRGMRQDKVSLAEILDALQINEEGEELSPADSVGAQKWAALYDRVKESRESKKKEISRDQIVKALDGQSLEYIYGILREAGVNGEDLVSMVEMAEDAAAVA